MRRITALAAAIFAAIVIQWQGRADAQDPTPGPGSAERGQELFIVACAPCHGRQGEGTPTGPALTGAGAASADFQLRSGRMPPGQPRGEQPLTRAPAFDEQAIRDLVADVASLGDGPPIPMSMPTHRSPVEWSCSSPTARHATERREGAA